MSRPPLILVAPHIEAQGADSRDLSLQVSLNYQRALLAAGGLPLVMPVTTTRRLIAECVRLADGVLLTGGQDVNPRLASPGASARLRATAKVTPDGGRRDLREILVVDEAFRQRKPLLAICRGQQLLNVALGGTLVPDILSLHPKALNHQRQDLKREIVHEVRLTAGSLLASIIGKRNLGVNSTHHQAVERVAGPLKVVARSPDGVIEGLELRADARRALPFLLAVQFHPERLVDRYPEHRAIFEAFVRACAANNGINL
ncbi:MAG TPA: gamma-glutamyl-gamma-aminobutyrate hydrolase family protein [Verrucomicrobiota bacterium]|jgi:putative glutamine amidotransferase|nr:MAG: Gamma-glutamyl-gamma-aminobutyrate hydrolase PuuD [Verrucomicrobia bacterium ADurb.Bin118]HQB16768.1 gamma-glutamyl-gamma-aminobutyrate hydrolase family protein [Verrucomicrobiota bacterium]